MTDIILSLCGGGLRGCIEACALVELERQLGGLTRQHISYVSGTSTGALLAAAIAAGVPAAELLTVYTERSKKIFTPSGPIATAKRAALGYMYNPANLKKVLASVFGPNAAAYTLNQSPLRVMIPAVDMSGHDWFFVSDNPKNSHTTGSVSLIDAAVASASAPTYFDSWPMTVAGKPLRFFDGGAGGQGNPVYMAAVEAFEYDSLSPATTRIISLGTGFFPQPSLAPKGLLKTIEWSLDTLLDTGEDASSAAVQLKYGAILTTINPQLSKAIDMADLSAIPLLVQIGQKQAAGLDWKKLIYG